ncbi:porphobilinogen synthase [Streptosporangium nondiastaticum]|uniref:Delta-aminolevulinic acid dehydratase n=2 Tax=Actinomycetes TaxID=1760 RepID=A0A9X7JSI5_9ACTN|nr:MULTISPECIES: porphobilinogen synthase [Actinomycetes]PSJ29030.1 porphobilinogen synthase [Streptosporangium nondiastaticum]WKU49147.1 porphobilinogen synthase [Streptomyces sp. VNUA116]
MNSHSTLGPAPASTPAAAPLHRPRRLRRTPQLRRLTAETQVNANNLIQPLFLREGITEPREIPSMPGVYQHTRDSLRKAAAEAVAAGVGGVMLFGIPKDKDERGSGAVDPDGILQTALRDVTAEVGDATVVIGDINLDEYTTHGHTGVLGADGDVDNDASVLLYARAAVVQADAGAHIVAPSGMMDGQVRHIRAALDEAGHHNVAILGYSAKYASHFYGPFRDAVESSLQGNRRTYQQYPGNIRESLREVDLDLAEGADMVMVKPALAYLDIVRLIADRVDVPVSAYQVSGEYSMIEAAAERGWIDRDGTVLESLTAIHRAGASQIITYWATEFAPRVGR